MNSPATALFITASNHERTERMPQRLPLPAADSEPASSSAEKACICFAAERGAEAAGYVGDDAQVGQREGCDKSRAWKSLQFAESYPQPRL